MAESNAERPVKSPGGRVEAPENEVIGAVARDEVGPAVCDLIDAGFAPIGIVAGDGGLRRIEATIGGGDGLGGLLHRVALNMGGDMDKLRQAAEELRAGHILIDVEVADDAAKNRARDILQRHGGHFITYFGRWSMETLG
ncbi:MAG TPA: hypothetical protein VFQ80_13540 [Thermomicrobiales bacterium]|jgi:hypothetical protein|nr:hypothetical protein [Thermomicrobiales bacterium]